MSSVTALAEVSLTPEMCRQARLSRDPRFDGKFYTAVKSTGIYCRPVCPAPSPKEENVEYYPSAVLAMEQGFRPCLRCRPDSAPDSFPWKGVETTLERALQLINDGALHQDGVEKLAERLGISARYLRKLFNEHLGTSPKAYALCQQLLFAKQLLHETTLSVTDIALASGFNSVRRFNDSFIKHFKLTPTQIRKSASAKKSGLRLFLTYRSPYHWASLHGFLKFRLQADMEWIGDNYYGRTFCLTGAGKDGVDIQGGFTAVHQPDKCGFDVSIQLSDLSGLLAVKRMVRRILDLDCDPGVISDALNQVEALKERVLPGLRIPSTVSQFEAGIKAVLGQQVSVKAANTLTGQLISQLGETVMVDIPVLDHIEKPDYDTAQQTMRLFPTPLSIYEHGAELLKMPGRRKQALADLCQYCHEHPGESPDEWLAIKGIGPWTVQYAKLRGLADSNIWLAGDLGVIKGAEQHGVSLDPAVIKQQVAPWASYLTFQLWYLLAD